MYRTVLVLLNLSNVVLLSRGRLITCVCTTTHCQEQQTRTCNTTSMCFSQYLDRRDGTDPVVKGCITSKTPLLCENRKPAIQHASWPVLLCCNKNMCNLDVEPTPAGFKKDAAVSKKGDLTTMPPDTTPTDTKAVVVTEKETSNRPVDSRHSFGTLYIAVLVAGVLCLLLIGAIAVLVLRRQPVFFNEEFGPVQRNGYLKGQSTDMSVADVHRTAPNILGRTYDNKLVLNT